MPQKKKKKKKRLSKIHPHPKKGDVEPQSTKLEFFTLNPLTTFFPPDHSLTNLAFELYLPAISHHLHLQLQLQLQLLQHYHCYSPPPPLEAILHSQH